MQIQGLMFPALKYNKSPIFYAIGCPIHLKVILRIFHFLLNEIKSFRLEQNSNRVKPEWLRKREHRPMGLRDFQHYGRRSHLKINKPMFEKLDHFRGF